jgi:hypothetical protein
LYKYESKVKTFKCKYCFSLTNALLIHSFLSRVNSNYVDLVIDISICVIISKINV